MMGRQTVQQLLDVFRNFRDNHQSGMPLHRAYQKGVRTVADAYAITYQTVGDGCRRRLGLKKINELYGLLNAWAKGEPRGLMRQLIANSDPSSRVEIEQFFSARAGAEDETRKASPKGLSRDEAEIFQFRLPAPDSRFLKALAELQGISPSDLIAQTMSVAVRERMAAAARSFIQNVDANA